MTARSRHGVGYGGVEISWASRVGAVGQWQAAAGSRRLCPARGGAARGDDALAHGRGYEGRGNRRSQECLDVRAQRVPRWPRAQRGAPMSRGTSFGAPGARTLQTDLL
jgi:hypothetical protein